jgi:hypothetical protein
MRSILALVLLAFAASPSARADYMGDLGVPRGIKLESLFKITNDRDATMDTFNLMVDEKNLAAGVLISVDPRKREANPDHAFWLRDIEKPEGVVLVEAQGHKVLLLQGQLDRATQEGRFHVKFLTNGISNSYSSCDFLLKKTSSGWYAKNAYTGQKVTNMKIISWSLGLKTLQGICPEKQN